MPKLWRVKTPSRRQTQAVVLIEVLNNKKDGTVLARQSLPNSGSSKN
jgi:hypothetical protein